ncbi:hypothetical protein PIB30_056033 [Stylosanthes scabra]|uniref:Uncharacterized protein n=1 Tax=Stylosanthes scabra TaxID=79078 RepID=A0ABU6WJ48_9FABA|nr:hypothetical protein [Stylosanthes scabra]
MLLRLTVQRNEPVNAKAKERLLQGLGVVSLDYEIRAARAGLLFSLSYLSRYDKTYRTSSPSPGRLSKLVCFFGFHREHSSGARAFAPYTLTSDGSSTGPETYSGTSYSSSPSPPPSDDEPSVGTFDSAAELEGDPDEPYIADHVPIGAPEAYYSDASYGSEQESASTDSAPSSHHSSDSSSGSVSLGYGSVSSGSASDGASDDDLVNRYFAETILPP